MTQRQKLHEGACEKFHFVYRRCLFWLNNRQALAMMMPVVKTFSMAHSHNQSKLATLQPISGSEMVLENTDTNIWRQPFSNLEQFDHNQYWQTTALV